MRFMTTLALCIAAACATAQTPIANEVIDVHVTPSGDFQDTTQVFDPMFDHTKIDRVYLDPRQTAWPVYIGPDSNYYVLKANSRGTLYKVLLKIYYGKD